MKDDEVILTWKGIQKKVATGDKSCQLVRTESFIQGGHCRPLRVSFLHIEE